jgi:hypothetical protein
MVINEVAKGNAALLVDEQGTGNELPAEFSVQVSEGELSWYFPANAVLDPRRKHVITRIYLFDGDARLGAVIDPISAGSGLLSLRFSEFLCHTNF